MKFDVVVIGSGFGGAIVGARLAQSGRRVCVLERGKYFHPRPAWKPPRSDQESNDLPRPRYTNEQKHEIGETAIWNPAQGDHGFIDFASFRGIDVLRGATVGGGSVIYYGVSERAPAEIFEDPWPAPIDRELLDRYYDRAENMLHLQNIADRKGDYKLPARTKKFREMAKACEIDSRFLDMAISFRDPKESMRKSCDLRGQCLVGCNQNAKNSLDFNYLKLARRCGCIIQPGAEAQLLRQNGSGYVVIAKRLGVEIVDHYQARTVVLAAGSLGSTELLLRSRAHPDGINLQSPALGHRFSTNGDYIYAGIQYRGEDVFPAEGPHVTIGLRYPRRGGKGTFFVHDLGIPGSLSPLLESTARTLPAVNTITLGLFRNFLTGHNKKWMDIPGDPSQWFLPILVMGQEDRLGKMSLRNGALHVHWPITRNRKYYEEVRNVIKDLAKRSGGQFRDNVWAGAAAPSTLTAHPLGGCPMGENADTGVVDHVGKVFGHENLYVADGSIIPSALSANPSLTISALAERIAFRMIHRRELKVG